MYVSLPTKSEPKESSFLITHGNSSQRICFEDSYPFDLTQYLGKDFLDWESFGVMVKREENILSDDEDNEDLEQRYSFFTFINNKTNVLEN